MSRRIRVTGGPWPERVGLEGCLFIPTALEHRERVADANPQAQARTHRGPLRPERVGLEGCILIPTPEQAKHYPFLGRSKDEVIVLIDDDPLNGPGTKFAGGWWTCAISKACVIDIGDWHARQ